MSDARSTAENVSHDPDPNPWNLLHDDAKTLITLATAILGVSATFGKSLLSAAGGASHWLLASWILTALSIVMAMFGSATVFSKVKENKSPGGAASFCLNIAFIALLLGVSGIAFVAYTNWSGPSASTPKQEMAAAEAAVATAQRVPELTLRVTSFRQLDSMSVQVTVADVIDRRSFAVVIDSTTHKATVIYLAAQ